MHSKINTVLACLALLVATAGVGSAASGLIGSKQIANHSIKMVDLNSSAVSGLRGQQGPRGPMGPMGPQGLAGAQGLAGLAGGFDPSKVTYVTGPELTIAPGAVGVAVASCPVGAKAVSGGFLWGYQTGTVTVQSNGPLSNGAGWAAGLANTGTINANVTAYAVCAAP